jgi:ribonuclease VapC
MSGATTAVLDASAVLAILQNEPGAEKLTDDVLSEAVASAVNICEVQTKLVRKGLEPNEAWAHASSPVASVEPLTAELAKAAGGLVLKTKAHGLSLGDRSCLALAISLKAPVYTTEKAWKGLRVGIPIHVIR